MHFTVTKEIRSQRKPLLRDVVLLLIALIAIPVVVIATLSLLLFALGSWIISLFTKRKSGSAADPYYLERPFLENEWIRITVVEDERDTELTGLNETWNSDVFEDDDYYLYRARTVPVVPALHDRVICFFLQEREEGAILQTVSLTETGNGSHVTTQLVYLQYKDLEVTPIDEAGGFCLYNDEHDPDLIKGLNHGEQITIRLTAKS